MYQQINDIINKAVNNYTDKLIDTYNLDRQELQNLWKEVCTSSQYSINTKNPSPAKKTVSEKKSNTVYGTCPYVITRGSRSGEECGIKTKDGRYFAQNIRNMKIRNQKK